MCTYWAPKFRDSVVVFSYSSTADGSVDVPLDPTKLIYIGKKEDCGLVGIYNSTMCTAYVIAANMTFGLSVSSPVIKYSIMKAVPNKDYFGFTLKISRFDLKTETFETSVPLNYTVCYVANETQTTCDSVSKSNNSTTTNSTGTN